MDAPRTQLRSRRPDLIHAWNMILARKGLAVIDRNASKKRADRKRRRGASDGQTDAKAPASPATATCRQERRP